MTHKKLIVQMAQRMGWPQTKVSDTLDAAVALLNEKLSENAAISVPDFGVFETRRKSERISVNPQTGQRYLVPPCIVAAFKPAQAVKEQLKNRESDGR